jgi:hypothetical protein
MLWHPKTVVAQLFQILGQLDGLSDCFAGIFILPDRYKVES